MTQYIIKRLLQAVVVIIGVLFFTFALLQLTGDPARATLPLDADPEAVEQMRQKLRLDEPIPVQFYYYILNVLKGDFGDSLTYKHQPAREIVFERLPATIQLALSAWITIIVTSLIIGMIAAIRRGSIIDNISMVFAMFGQCLPSFWLGLMLILLFAVTLKVLPTSGRQGWDLRYLILPTLTISAPSIAVMTRIVRSGMLEVLNKDYILTARSKGLNGRVIFFRHALKNVAIPLVTLYSLQLGGLLSGSMITETIFGWPGVGLLSVNAIGTRDFPIVSAVVFYVATGFVLINLFVDILYTYLDPRVRLQGKEVS